MSVCHWLLSLVKIILTVGFDINTDRIEDLKKGIDHTNEATPEQLRSADTVDFYADINDIKDL